MGTYITNTTIQQLEAELREAKSKFAKGFHRGKSMSELKDVVEKIHILEQQFIAIKPQDYLRQ